MGKLFNEFCEKVNAIYEREGQAAELKEAPYSKEEAKAFTKRLFEEKKALYQQSIGHFVEGVRGKQDIKRLSISLNRGHLKGIPQAAAGDIDEHIFLGKHADEYLEDILAAIEADPDINWGPSIPEREIEIARLEKEAQVIREDLSFSFQKIGRSNWWPHSRLTEEGRDRWLIEAGGPSVKVGDLGAIYEWLKSNEGKSLFNKVVGYVKSAI